MDDMEWHEYLEVAGGLSKYTLRAYKHAYYKIALALKKSITKSAQRDIITVCDDDKSKATTKQQLINVAIQIRRFHQAPVDMLIKFRERLFLQIADQKNQANREKVDDLPSVDDLKLHAKRLYAANDWRKYIVFELMSSMSTRNQDLNLIIVGSKKQATDPNENYLVARKTDLLYVRRNYKTASSYGEKQNIIKNKKINTAVWRLIGESGGQLPLPLLTKHGTNTRIAEDSVQKYVRGTTPDGISESDVFKIHVTQVESLKDYSKLKKMSQNRGTRVENVIEHYNLNVRT